MSKNASLAEMMGKPAEQSGESMTLGSLPKILGNAMPELPKNSVGRHRLVRSLQQRFGSNWRSLPGLKGIVKEFDDEVAVERKIAQIRAIKTQGRKK